MIAARKMVPHIYFIVCGEYLYIGETSRHPCLRWGEHLLAEGSFSKAFFKHADKYLSNNDLICFFALDISQYVSNRLQLQLLRRYSETILRQAIESAVHQEYDLNPHRLIKRLTIISDISKTTPRKFRDWDVVKLIAKEILERVASEINEAISKNNLGMK